MKTLLLSFVFSLVSLFSFGQTFFVLVLNESDGSPVQAAEVITIVEGVNDTLRSITDVNGLAPVDVDLGRAIRLQAQKDGASVQAKKIVVTENWVTQNSYVTFMLPWEERNRVATSPETAEEIISLDSLPAGYKILEARPVREQKVKRGGYNVITREERLKEHVDVSQVVENQSQRYEQSQPVKLNAEEEGSSVFRESAIYYKPGKALLGLGVKEELDNAVDMLLENENLVLNIISYADGKGEASIADFVSQLRADVITQYLMNRDVPFSKLRITIRSNQYLENGCYPNTKCSAAEHAENRKVELYFERQ